MKKTEEVVSFTQNQGGPSAFARRIKFAVQGLEDKGLETEVLITSAAARTSIYLTAVIMGRR